MILYAFCILLLVSGAVIQATNKDSVRNAFSLIWLVSVVYININLGVKIFRYSGL